MQGSTLNFTFDFPAFVKSAKLARLLPALAWLALFAAAGYHYTNGPNF